MPIIKGAASDFTTYQRHNAQASSIAPIAFSRAGVALIPASAIAAQVRASQVSLTASATLFSPSVSPHAETPSRLLAAFSKTLTNAGSGNKDSFVAKYSSAGFVQWVAGSSGSSSDTAASVAVDSSGNIVVGGYYYSNPLTVFSA